MNPSIRRCLSFIMAVCCLPCAMAVAQSYTRIVVFGDSLSDTGNVAHLAQAKYGQRLPGPLFQYTDGRFTDGADTLPPATLFTGVWVEQLAALLPGKPVVKNSLDGGTNYAYGDATTGAGTAVVSYTVASVTVNNLGQQVTDYLATSPTIDSHTLFVVWGGANDLLSATAATDITNAANNEIAIVQRLIGAGATDIIVPNVPPLGATPRLNGNSLAAAQANTASQLYGVTLFTALAQLPAAYPGKTLHLFPLETYALFRAVIAVPGAGLDNVTAASQGHPSVNPDRYLFWDDVHPTTTGHHLLAMSALQLLTPLVATTTTTLASSAANSNANSAVTFTATVAAASGGAPTGTVMFSADGAAIGTATLSSAGTTSSTATVNTATLTPGPHSIVGVYSGDANHAVSTSPAFTQVVTAPAVSYAATPTSLAIARGSSGTTTITATPVGGFSQAISFSCPAASLPADFTCSFAPASVTPSGSNAPVTTVLTIGTKATAALWRPRLHSRPGTLPQAAFALLLPATFGVVFARRRNRSGLPGLLLLLCMLAAAMGLSGCGGSDNRAPAGTYTVQVQAASSAGSSNLPIQVTVQ